MRESNRRHFLWMVAGAGSSVGVGSADVILRCASGRASHCADRSSSENVALRAERKTAWALGSDISVTVLHPDSETADRAIDVAFGEIKLIDELMSIYRSESQLCRLNRKGVLEDPHPYLVEVLNEARLMSMRSGGAFDVTVQPLWRLFDNAAKAGRLPELTEVRRVRQAVNWRCIDISPSRIRFRCGGMAVTLNGIAQGFAADKAARALRAGNVQHALLNTGEIGALGRKQNGDCWKVGVQHPRLADAFISLVKLGDRCLATSGDYATTFSADFRANHLFDPRTGLSPTELSSVSVVATTAVQADALSTASFVLGPTGGVELVRSTPQADALFVFKDGTVLTTNGFPLEA